MADDFRRNLKTLPIRPAALDLPAVKPPSLEGLTVAVSAPEPLSDQVLTQRFYAVARQRAARRAREAEEAVALGDDVLLDVLGFSDDKLVPFSIKLNWATPLSPQHMPEDLCNGIAGMKVGSANAVDVLLPADYPVANLRGKHCLFTVRVLEASEVTVPDFQDVQFLKTLDRGDTLDAVLHALIAEYKSELTESLVSEARERVFDELVARTDVWVPPALVDEEIRRHWTTSEGEALSQKGFPAKVREDALACWLQDAATRRDVERRIRLALGLGAIVTSAKLKLTTEHVERVLLPVAEQMGMTLSGARSALMDQSAQAQDVIQVAMHFMAVSHVMERATIRWPS